MAKSSINNYETIHEITFFDPESTGIWSPMKLEVQVNKNHPKYVNRMHTQNSNYHIVRVRVVPETLH